MSNSVECPICGVLYKDGQFYWTRKFDSGNRQPASPEEVSSKVCSIAKACGRNTEQCINKQGKFDASKTWLELDSETFNALVEHNSI